MVRSLYWLGVLAADAPEAPSAFALTPLGGAALAGAAVPDAVPEEPRFVLQPNAEAFAPPNLAPRTFFQLRRLTGETRGGTEGMYPVSGESLRRALDSGLSGEEIATFLERFSRTGLPANVRALVESAARQHGRIRLIRAECVLVTDEPALLDELTRLRGVGSHLRRRVTERAAIVEGDGARLVRVLRERGYSPADLTDPVQVPPLLEEAETAPAAAGPVADGAPAPDAGAPAAGKAPRTPAPLEPRGTVRTMHEIRDLLRFAEVAGAEVEIEYRGRTGTTVRTILPLAVEGAQVEAWCFLRGAERAFTVTGIRWARLTGEEV
jgi:hypothetical protein